MLWYVRFVYFCGFSLDLYNYGICILFTWLRVSGLSALRLAIASEWILLFLHSFTMYTLIGLNKVCICMYVYAHSASTVRAGEQNSVSTNSRPRAFQRAIDEPCTLPMTPPMADTKSDFAIFSVNFNFCRKKSAAKILHCENFQRQTGSYIIPPSWKNRKIVVYQSWFERFWRSLARRCILNLLTVSTVKNLKFQKSKTAAAAILKNRKNAIGLSRPRFDRFWRNLAQWCISNLLTVSTEDNGDVRFLTGSRNIFQLLKIQDGGRSSSWKSKMGHISGSELTYYPV